MIESMDFICATLTVKIVFFERINRTSNLTRQTNKPPCFFCFFILSQPIKQHFHAICAIAALPTHGAVIVAQRITVTVFLR